MFKYIIRYKFILNTFHESLFHIILLTKTSNIKLYFFVPHLTQAALCRLSLLLSRFYAQFASHAE